MTENLPEIYTPKELASITEKKLIPNSSQIQIANNTLRDINEVLKTVESIADKLGFNLKQIMDKKLAVPEAQEKPNYPTMKEPIITAPAPEKPKQEIIVLSKEATEDLLKAVEEVYKNYSEATAKDIYDFLKIMSDNGMMEKKVEEFLKKYTKLQ